MLPEELTTLTGSPQQINLSTYLKLTKINICENKLLTDFINENDPILKKELNTDYEKYRNLLSALTKKSTQAFIMINILRQFGILLRTHGK